MPSGSPSLLLVEESRQPDAPTALVAARPTWRYDAHTKRPDADGTQQISGRQHSPVLVQEISTVVLPPHDAKRLVANRAPLRQSHLEWRGRVSLLWPADSCFMTPAGDWSRVPARLGTTPDAILLFYCKSAG
jgi:hypothetical protein